MNREIYYALLNLWKNNVAVNGEGGANSPNSSDEEENNEDEESDGVSDSNSEVQESNGDVEELNGDDMDQVDNNLDQEDNHSDMSTGDGHSEASNDYRRIINQRNHSSKFFSVSKLELLNLLDRCFSRVQFCIMSVTAELIANIGGDGVIML